MSKCCQHSDVEAKGKCKTCGKPLCGFCDSLFKTGNCVECETKRIKSTNSKFPISAIIIPLIILLFGAWVGIGEKSIVLFFVGVAIAWIVIGLPMGWILRFEILTKEELGKSGLKDLLTFAFLSIPFLIAKRLKEYNKYKNYDGSELKEKIPTLHKKRFITSDENGKIITKKDVVLEFVDIISYNEETYYLAVMDSSDSDFFILKNNPYDPKDTETVIEESDNEIYKEVYELFKSRFDD